MWVRFPLPAPLHCFFMKFAIFVFLILLTGRVDREASASEGALDCQSAIETLKAGLEVHPGETVVLFQDSLQSNPACRRQLLMSAIELTGGDAEMLAKLIQVARTEFPGDDSLFAEAAMSVVPERSAEIRQAFMAAPAEMGKPLAATSDGPSDTLPHPVESQVMDEEIREAIARVTAKTEGKYWPEQKLSEEPLHYRKPDEVRVSRKSRDVDEASLANSGPTDKHDEREITPGPVRLEDSLKPSSEVRLDETRFAKGDKSASVGPLPVGARSIAPAGPVGLPRRPVLSRSSVYYIAPAADSYRSTVDQETGEEHRPALVIRPTPTSPTSPK